MAPGRNGVPTPAAGALRTAERTGGAAAKAPRPRSGQGPFDVDDTDPTVVAGLDVLDFGAIRVPIPAAGSVTVEPTANGRMQAVHIAMPQGKLSVSALAAPKSAKLWPQLAKEIDASLREGGARVRSHRGEWGRELHATTGSATSVFVGVDGPRWMLYGVATGPTRDSAALDAELRAMLRGVVVVRGRSPYPVRTVLPLVTPGAMAGEPGAAAETSHEAAPRSPERTPEPAWADPLRRVADEPADGVDPDESADDRADDGRSYAGSVDAFAGPARRSEADVATSAWPVGEPVDRGPAWLAGPERDDHRGGRRAPAPGPAGPTEPIPLSPARDEPSGDVEDTVGVEITARLPVVRPTDLPARGADRPRRSRHAADHAQPGDRYAGMPADPPRPAAGLPAEPAPDRDHDTGPGVGIDTYYGWDTPTADRPRGRAADAGAPFDPLDPAAPVDTRWLDDADVTTAWEAIGGELLAGSLGRLDLGDRDRAEPPPPRTDEPRRQPVWPDWSQWDAERAVPEPPADPPATGSGADDSFWDRFGPAEPAAGRHGGGHHDEPDPPASVDPAPEDTDHASRPTRPRSFGEIPVGELFDRRARRRADRPDPPPADAQPADAQPADAQPADAQPADPQQARHSGHDVPEHVLAGADHPDAPIDGSAEVGPGGWAGGWPGYPSAGGPPSRRTRHTTSGPATGRRRRPDDGDERETGRRRPTVADLVGETRPRGRHRSPGDEV